MKRLFAVGLLVAAPLCVACREPLSLASPSPLQRHSLSLPSPAPGTAPRESLAAWHAAAVAPFRGSFEGTQTLTPQGVNASGAGTGTHLGLFTVAFPHTVNFADRTGKGTYTFTAANGDTLTADFNGQAQGGPIVSIVEHATVTGGTGRFAGSTGSFVVERRFDSTTGRTEGSFEGTITNPGAGN